jgi:hypothetical protein
MVVPRRQSYRNFLSSEKGGCDFRFWPKATDRTGAAIRALSEA